METASDAVPVGHGQHRDLLAQAARVYERHHASRRPRFNVFTALRSARDEVNLHSRFLHALLTPPADASGCNLSALLSEIGVDGVDAERATLAREENHIDLLVTDAEQAVVIENKLDAPDGERQLQRYHESLRSRYADDAIHLVYLTLDGHSPSKQSVGDLASRCREVSYAELIPWLTGCQQRAFDEPALRESIGQYISLIEQLTGNDQNGVYMDELRHLLLQDDNNLVIARDIWNAFLAAKTEAALKLWSTINATLHKAIPDLPDLDPDWKHWAEREQVAKCVNPQSRKSTASGLYYRITEGAWFFVVANPRLWFGIECDPDASNPEPTYEDLRNKLAGITPASEPSDWSPWWRWPSKSPNLRDNDDASLHLLASPDSQQALADEITADACRIWDRVKES